jgi:hypothetical protein
MCYLIALASVAAAAWRERCARTDNVAYAGADSLGAEVISYFDSSGNLWEVLNVALDPSMWFAGPLTQMPAAAPGSPLISDVNGNTCTFVGCE